MSKVVRTIAKVAVVVGATVAFGPQGGLIAAKLVGGVEAATSKKPRAPGVTNQFTIDPQAGIPYCIGRTFTGGRIVHVDGYGGTENPFRSYVMVFSGGGPADSIESVLVDRSPVSVGPGGASGYYNDFMWLSTQLGTSPVSAALAAPFAGFPGWGSAHKLSGYAAGLWTLKFDKKGKRYASGQPEFGVVGKWAKVYDPRLDSTFPGGSGTARALQENTYVWSQNGPLHALTWALGRWQNGKRALGVGIDPQDIDLQAFVDAANVFDANGWAVGGVLDGSGDKWNTLRTILWAGAAEPLDLGGLLSCRFESPKVSLATIAGGDLADGEIVVPAMKTWRDRINSIIPRYRSEAHNWEIIPASAVRGATYIAEDGEERTRESEYYCCQSLTQAAQLAAYEIAFSREIDGITIPLKTKFVGYKPGDCLTLNIPEANLNGQTAIVTNRTLDPATGIVTMTFRTETAAKHAWALGNTSTAPPGPVVTSSAVMDALIWNNRAAIPEEPFNPLTTYDFGRIVNLGNGARYIYINDTASAGNPPPDWPTTSNAYWQNLGPPTAYRTTFGGPVPSAASSNVGDIHVADDGRVYERVNSGGILLGGFAVTLGGFRPQLAWTAKAVQPVINAGQTANWSQVTDDDGTLPEASADVTKFVNGPSTINLARDSGGAIKAGQLGRTFTYQLTASTGAVIAADVTWAVETSVGVWSATVPSIAGTGSGTLTINSDLLGAAGTLKVTATFAGRAYTFSVSITTTQDAPAISSASTASDNTLASWNSISFGAISDVLSVTLPTGVTQATLTAANITLTPAVAGGNGSTDCLLKWQWDSTGGGAWADVGSFTNSNPDPSVLDFETTDGSITNNQVKTGLTAGNTYKFRLMAANSTGVTGRTIFPSGQAVAKAG